jgi:predicted transposase/invertase (TIGR01784 family)
MMYAEWDLEAVKGVWYEDGLKDGMERGMAQGMVQGLERGLTQGMEQGIVQGLERGLTQGMEQGSRQSRLEIARNFKRSGLPAEQIARNTGLSVEEIRAL